jgi:hypothetical protein
MFGRGKRDAGIPLAKCLHKCLRFASVKRDEDGRIGLAANCELLCGKRKRWILNHQLAGIYLEYCMSHSFFFFLLRLRAIISAGCLSLFLWSLRITKYIAGEDYEV